MVVTPRTRGLPWLSATRLASVIASVWLAASCGQRSVPAPANDLEIFADALGTRPVAARLSGLKARPFRDDAPAQSQLSIAGLEAWARISARASTERRPADLRALAAVLLLRHQPHKALALLLEAIEREPSAPPSADAWSDLAAARIAAADVDEVPARSLTRAIDAAQHAIRLRHDTPQAWFNLALALQRLGLSERSVAVWSTYARLESDAAWREEGTAQARRAGIDISSQWQAVHRVLAQLGSAEVAAPAIDGSRFAQELRETLEVEYLPAWADAYLRRAPDVEQASRRVARVAALTSDTTGDPMMAAAARVVTSAPPPDAGMELARGHLAHARGLAAFERGQYEMAVEAFDDGERRLAKANSPFAAWSRLLRAVSLYHSYRFSEASQQCEGVLRMADLQRFTALAGRAYWLRGVIALKLGHPERALEAYDEAINRFERIGERENVANVAGAKADTLRLLGSNDQGWVALGQALTRFSSIRNLRRQYTLTLNASLFASADDSHLAALLYQDSAVAIASRYGVPNFIAESASRRAALGTEVGDYEAAAADLGLAEKARTDIQSAASKAYQTAWIDAVRGRLLLRTHPSDAELPLTRAIAFLTRVEPAEVPRLHLVRGQAALASGEIALARQHFVNGIQEFERRWTALAVDEHRVSYLDEGWFLYREIVGLLLSEPRDVPRAFAYAERARARTLDAAQRGDSADAEPDLAALQAVVPSDAAVVYYAQLPSAVVIWTITRAAVDCRLVPVDGDRLERLVTAYRKSLENGQASVSLATELHDLLVAPVANAVPPQARLVFVPDGVLHGIPFATLIDRRTTRHLIEGHAIATSPSAKAFVRATHQLERLSDRTTLRALVVGDPQLEAGSTLPKLPEARAEASDIGALYAGSQILTGADATRERFLALAPRFDVLHVAAHAIANTSFPQQSRLVLAAGRARGSGDLFSRDIERADFGRPSLVVLSACSTAYGAIYRGEGAMSLARPFLASGAPAVVASLWDVQDAAARRLLNGFHREFLQHRDASRALQTVQRQMLAASADASEWGSFEAIAALPKR
jgi:CHAT domain-containing protein